jgi:hypothetical protein
MQSTMTCAGCRAAPSGTNCPVCGRPSEQSEFGTAAAAAADPIFRLHLSAADRLGVRATPPPVFNPNVAFTPPTAGASNVNAFAATAAEVAAFESGKKTSAFKVLFVLAALVAAVYFGLPALRHATSARQASIGDCVQIAAPGAAPSVVPCTQPHVGHVVSKVASAAQCVGVASYAVKYHDAEYCVSNQPN